MDAPTINVEVTDEDALALDILGLDTGTLDSGQLDTGQLDTGQLSHFTGVGASLAIINHEIHRVDELEQGGRELITSTLKYFSLNIAVQDPSGASLHDLDGTLLTASLVYENGWPVEELSMTQEPPLLAAAGEFPPKALVEGAVATFRLRITVLSSLVNKRNFCVRVSSVQHPELTATTKAVKTLTKLRRGVRESRESAQAPSPLAVRSPAPADENVVHQNGTSKEGTWACGAKRAISLLVGDMGEDLGCLEELARTEVAAACLEGAFTDALATSSLDELWDQVSVNGARLLELEAQQQRLFKELRAMKGK